MKRLHFIGAYDGAMPRDMFLQHIAEMHHISFDSGTEITVEMLEDKLNDHFRGDEAAQKAADEFISFQHENGHTKESVVMEKSATRAVLHFDLREVKHG